jgi:riboflavin synthase
MFTGIITNLARIEEIKIDDSKDSLLKISINNHKKKSANALKIGSSISCNGICLTLIKKKIIKNNTTLYFQASEETLKKTTLKNWKKKQAINVEFAMKVGDEFGGHIVSGHIDDTVKILSIKKIKDSWQIAFELKENLAKYIVQKGSIAIDGVSLTVNEIEDSFFKINLIPHSFLNTNFQYLKVGDLVNIEIDLIARYLMKLSNFSSSN